MSAQGLKGKKTMTDTKDILIRARNAKQRAMLLTTEEKNKALLKMADSLSASADDVLAANTDDLDAARGTVSEVMLDRLALSHERISAMAQGMRDVAALADPVGRVLESKTRDDGLLIQKISVPMGVVAIIYESRPNVTSDAAALALKSGNVCVLRGGKEAFRTSFAITEALRKGVAESGLDPNLINIVEDTTRESANQLMRAVGYVDLLIPRGGAGLINACVENARVPCIQTGTGICHIYVDKSADLEKAVKIVENAKMSRPSVCNAAEVCLVHRDVANEFLPLLKSRLCDSSREHTAQLRCDSRACAVIGGTAAQDSDFDTEFLDYILAVKVVDDLSDAVAHIAAHSTHHSDAIVTEDGAAAKIFTASVDSSAVYVNASTRFTDGGEFGLGCEMGISTQKLHARGPMGLCELNTYKYIIIGNGHTR